MHKRIAILILALGLTSAMADMWTNAAGHGMAARLISLEKDTVTLQRSRGKPFKMKLSGFCAADQKRIRKHFGQKEIPTTPSATDLAYEKQMERLRQLRVAGRMSDEEFRRQQAAMLNHFYGGKDK